MDHGSFCSSERQARVLDSVRNFSCCMGVSAWDLVVGSFFRDVVPGLSKYRVHLVDCIWHLIGGATWLISLGGVICITGVIPGPWWL